MEFDSGSQQTRSVNCQIVKVKIFKVSVLERWLTMCNPFSKPSLSFIDQGRKVYRKVCRKSQKNLQLTRAYRNHQWLSNQKLLKILTNDTRGAQEAKKIHQPPQPSWLKFSKTIAALQVWIILTPFINGIWIISIWVGRKSKLLNNLSLIENNDP